ncbi:hypothetical protein ETU08_03705 [Apibacter muscae]|uniref:hypothetical protein n=1 Tax=Apibacter muscae TaxID=2509004 RepID=UPI0011AC774E|nr:hypothetical protein [Apibacter muscae]TWP31122.1 hypothetical protein ETU08_03705 [Apibacter muscae]
MKKIYLLLILVSFITYSSCSDDLNDSVSIPSDLPRGKVVNRTGSIDGVNYSLKNLEINPNLIKINSENAKILSSSEELNLGTIRLDVISTEIGNQLISGNVLFIQTGDHTYFKRITSVIQNNNSFTIETVNANLGDIFEDGTLDLSMDIKESTSDQQSLPLVSAKSINDFDHNYSLFNFDFIKEFTRDGITLNPNTSVKSAVHLSLSFKKNLPLPKQIEVYYVLNSNISPYFSFLGGINKKVAYNLADNIPDNILELIKKVSIDIKIPTNEFLGELPAKVSIKSINIPTEIEANLGKKSLLAYNTSGSLKIGFAYYNNVPGKTSHPIYENSMQFKGINDTEIIGEIASDMRVSITPKIELFDTNLLDVSGDVVFGINSYSIGNGSTTQSSNFLSNGNFYSSATFYFKTLGVTAYTTELFKENKELWNLGSFNKSIEFSNLSLGKASTFPCSGLNSFSINASLDYKYPIYGKKLSGKLEMSYDVYADNGSFLETKKISINPSNISSNNFNFSLCIPFRKINFFQTAKTSYLRNIIIKDDRGFTANGIKNPKTGEILSEIKVSR